MRRIPTLITAATIGILMIQTAEATPINARQHHQSTRIAQGMVTGELTCRETKALIKEQRRIARTERRFRSDGRLGPVERRILQAQLNRASSHIYVAKHNAAER